MIPLIILAGRNNPLIPLLQISFDTYNLIHRWMGRIVVLESVIHTLCWAYVKHAATGWSGIFEQIRVDPFASWGVVGIGAMITLFITGLSPVRHAFSETFLDIHILMAAFALIGTWMHCHISNLPALVYVQVTVILWATERFARVIRIVYVNYARKGWTYATVEALPGEACRVTMHLPRKVNIKPGCHAYLRFASLSPWESHPFSIGWVEDKSNIPTLPITEKKGQLKLRDSDMVTDVSFV